MKKTKKALLAVLACSAVFAGAFGLAACNNGESGQQAHNHNYANWQSDGATTHTGTCDAEGDCDAKTKTEAHDTAGKDGACSKCDYKATGGDEDGKHTHNYSNWKSDGDTTHTGTCNAEGDCDAKTKTENHDTAGEDGACSKCGYKEEEPEEHTHDYTYSSNNDGTHNGTCNAEGDCDAKTVTNEACDTDGEGGVCSKCGYAEAEQVAKGYKVTVYGADGETVLSGVTVIIGEGEDEAEVVTNAQGVAEFAQLTRGEYPVTVDAGGYALVEDAVTGEDEEIKLYLAKVCENNRIEQSENGTVLYAASIGWRVNSETGKIEPSDVSYTIKNTGSSAAKYTVSLENIISFASYPNTPVHSVGLIESRKPDDDEYKPVSFVLEPGETFIVSLTADPERIGDTQDTNSYPVNYGFKVTRDAAPEKGSCLEYLCVGVIGGEINESDSDGAVYFKLDTNNYTAGYFEFDFDDDDMILYSLGANGQAAPVILEKGKAVQMSDYFPTVVRASSQSGHVAFSVTVSYADGTVNKPIEIVKGENYEETIKNEDNKREVWYTFTNTAEDVATYTFEPDSDNGSDTTVTVYSATKMITYSIAGKKTWFEMQPGETFRFAVGNVVNKGKIAFTLRDYDPENDINGDSIDTPYIITVEEGEHEYRVDFKEQSDYGPDDYVVVNKFYMFETLQPGYYTVEFAFDEDSGAQGEYVIADRFAVSNPRTETLKDYAVTLNNTLCLTSSPVCIKMTNNVNCNCFGTIRITFVPLVEKEHTVTVVADEEVRSGLTVTVKKDGEVVATGTTDASGVAAMTFMPGNYDVEISGFDAEIYGYKPVTIEFDKDGNNTEVALAALKQYQFTVVSPDEAQTVEGLTVTVKDGNEVVASGTTDSDGVFTTDKINAGVYRVEVTGTTSKYYAKALYTNGAENEYEVTLCEVKSITHASDTSEPDISEGRTTIKNASSSRSGRYNYKFTAEADGTYVISLSSSQPCGIYAVSLYKDASSKYEILPLAGTFNSDLNEELGNPVSVSGDPVTNYGYSTVTVNLKAGEFVVVALRLNTSNTNATGTCDIEKIA